MRTSDNESDTIEDFLCGYPGCTKSFKSSKGRGIHEQQVHKMWYDQRLAETAANNPNIKARWSAEESALLALEEAKLSLLSVVDINDHLVPLFPNRTKESIKGQRRKASHKAAVLKNIQDLQNIPPIPKRDNAKGPPQPPDSNASLHFRSNLKTHFSTLGPISSVKFFPSEVENICRNVAVWNPDRLLPELESYLVKIFPHKCPSREIRRPQKRNLPKRQQRRFDYGITQKQWKKNPCRAIKTILDNKSCQNPPDKDTMSKFWQTTFTNGGKNTPPDEVPDNTIFELWDHITIAEIKSCKPDLSTSPGPDGITAGQLRSLPDLLLVKILNLLMACGKVPNVFLESKTTLIPKKVDSKTPSDFRPITVQSILVRTLHKILASRVSKLVKIDDRQRAKRRSCN